MVIVIDVEFVMQDLMYLQNRCTLYCLQLSLTVKKKIGFVWFTAPCKDNVGSCTYDNICEMLPASDCPAILKKYGIPCHCPFAKVS